ncbi:MAG: phosphoribosylglycinamide formyltransferase [Bacteroidetes bacterium]|nr:phosphoribosylglycinamide formyltransferase [Bacteroidota bacterium]
MSIKRIAIFASGSGSNAENIYNYFKENSEVNISLILTNNPNAFVLERAKKLGIKSLVFNKEQFSKTDEILQYLLQNDINLIVLAGFLLKIPENLHKIINIHPALLPKYGGKGMFGDKVHQSVIANHEKESGITIHLVNENYDEGKIIFQAKCNILLTDKPEDLAKKIHVLEYEHFPKVIEKLLV